MREGRKGGKERSAPQADVAHGSLERARARDLGAGQAAHDARKDVAGAAGEGALQLAAALLGVARRQHLVAEVQLHLLGVV